MTLEEAVADFMDQNGLNSDNFALSYYNTVTGEAYGYNETHMMVAASTFKLPLNLYYYDLEHAGELPRTPISPEPEPPWTTRTTRAWSGPITRYPSACSIIWEISAPTRS